MPTVQAMQTVQTVQAMQTVLAVQGMLSIQFSRPDGRPLIRSPADGSPKDGSNGASALAPRRPLPCSILSGHGRASSARPWALNCA